MQSQILPSRAALVDRIALQFEYGQNLIVLLGTSGLGKSYMLETFITDKYNDFNKAFVQVTGKMTDTQLMSQLLEQSFNAPLVDHNLSLSENYYQLLQQQTCGPCLWVLDGGRHLSEEILIELESLAKMSPSTLYIMVASQSKLFFNDVVEIYLEPLSLRESKQLMSWYFTALPYDEDPVFQTFLSEARGNPSLLLAWQPTEHVADFTVKDKVSWRLHLLTLLLIIMFLIIGLLYKSNMTQWWQQYHQQEQPELLTLAIPVSEVSNRLMPPNEAPIPQILPGVINETKLKEHQNDVPAIMQSLKKASVETERLATNIKIAEEPPKPQVKNEQSDVEKNWYLQQPTHHIVIQLLAVTQQQISIEFITKYELEGEAYTYQTKRNNKIWWVVTFGNFASLEDAKLAMKTLPSDILKNKPFYKKISKIKQEIALVDQ
ncbi:AAA family ATPase [Pseudoalteromonas sp. SCSIO 43210]